MRETKEQKPPTLSWVGENRNIWSYSNSITIRVLRLSKTILNKDTDNSFFVLTFCQVQ